MERGGTHCVDIDSRVQGTSHFALVTGVGVRAREGSCSERHSLRRDNATEHAILSRARSKVAGIECIARDKRRCVQVVIRVGGFVDIVIIECMGRQKGKLLVRNFDQ